METCSSTWVSEVEGMCSGIQEAWAFHIPCRVSWEHRQRAWLGGQLLHMS